MSATGCARKCCMSQQTTIDQLARTRAIERSGGHQYTLIEGETRYGLFPGCTAICALQDSLMGSGGLMGWAVGQALDALEAAVPLFPLSAEARSVAFQAM